MATLLDQMADVARGQRIQELRAARHLTQPAIAELVGVTLRAYQAWEAGGGITWENAKVLAKKLGTDPEFIMAGAKPETPDPFAKSDANQLDRIETEVADLKVTVKAIQDALVQLAGANLRPPKEPPASGAADRP